MLFQINGPAQARILSSLMFSVKHSRKVFEQRVSCNVWTSVRPSLAVQCEVAVSGEAADLAEVSALE
jgi:hypothetical protein